MGRQVGRHSARESDKSDDTSFGEPLEGPFMVRQAHHERLDKHVLSLSKGDATFLITSPLKGESEGEDEDSPSLSFHGRIPPARGGRIYVRLS